MRSLLLLCLLGMFVPPLHAQTAADSADAIQQDAPSVTQAVTLDYIAPTELDDILGLDQTAHSSMRVLRIDPSDPYARVYVRYNPGLNQVLLTGTPDRLDQAVELIRLVDVPPRQIIVEVQILEVDEAKSLDAGLDWQRVLDQTGIHGSIDLRGNDLNQTESGSYDGEPTPRRTTNREVDEQIGRLSIGTSISLGQFIRLVRENGTGTFRNVPRIVTINNREGTILDGARINYVSKLAQFANVFETQELTTGLTLSVTPSLGESGYIKLDVTAKLTTLGQIIDNSPSEVGQILENTVVVRDGETFLLGGLKQVEQSEVRRKVPVLGTILPFLFSRRETIEISKDVLLLLTPRVIDLESATYDLPGQN